MTLMMWSASAVAALALTAMALSLLHITLSTATLAIAYFLWVSIIGLAMSLLAADGVHGSIANDQQRASRPRLLGTYLLVAILPACSVFAVLVTAPPKEGPELAVWLLPGRGGVGGGLTVRPGATYLLISGVEADRAGDREVRLLVDVAGAEAIRKSLAATSTPSVYSAEIEVPAAAKETVQISARAWFAGDPSSEVTARLNLRVLK
jgi:hypothetical protein